jgi:hypothetical protein
MQVDDRTLKVKVMSRSPPTSQWCLDWYFSSQQ